MEYIEFIVSAAVALVVICFVWSFVSKNMVEE